MCVCVGVCVCVCALRHRDLLGCPSCPVARLSVPLSLWRSTHTHTLSSSGRQGNCRDPPWPGNSRRLYVQVYNTYVRCCRLHGCSCLQDIWPAGGCSGRTDWGFSTPTRVVCTVQCIHTPFVCFCAVYFYIYGYINTCIAKSDNFLSQYCSLMSFFFAKDLQKYFYKKEIVLKTWKTKIG